MMIVSRVASESIRNMNETKYMNKKQKKVCKMMKQDPNMLEVLKIYFKNRKQHKQREFQKLTQNIPVYEKLNLNLEPIVNDV
jgi:hypothetical protein